jgi:hypothetical protein
MKCREREEWNKKKPVIIFTLRATSWRKRARIIRAGDGAPGAGVIIIVADFYFFVFYSKAEVRLLQPLVQAGGINRCLVGAAF